MKSSKKKAVNNKDIKKMRCIRLRDADFTLVRKFHGSVQGWVDAKVLELKKEVLGITK